jgi:hypothetical protein
MVVLFAKAVHNRYLYLRQVFFFNIDYISNLLMICLKDGRKVLKKQELVLKRMCSSSNLFSGK